MDGGWTASDAAEHLRKPTATDDKYSRGVVGIRTGSTAYPGAAVLGVEAAWRAGTGMVRYLGPDRATRLVLQRRPETVTVAGRVQAWVIGSGTDAAHRTPEESAALNDLLRAAEPVIVDAGALDLAVGASAPRVLTPHAGEHDRLRERLGLAPRKDRVSAARETAASVGACIVLKGSETVVATPGGWCVTLPPASAWLASAGTGDVLAGVIGAIVAGASVHGPPGDEILGGLAATGAWLHAQAAARAVAAADGGPITALDVTGFLPAVVGRLLAGH